MLERIEIENTKFIENASLTKNKSGVHFLVVNLSKRWPDYERESGILPNKDSYVKYLFEKEGQIGSVTLYNFEGDFKVFEEIEKDQFVVTYIPTDLLLKREELICSSKSK